MSWKSCMLLNLAKILQKSDSITDWYSPNKQKEIAKILCETFSVETLTVINSLELKSLTSGLPRSNSLYIGIPYIPPSSQSSYADEFAVSKEPDAIRNWVVLGVEIAGIDLSGKVLNKCLIKGRKQAFLSAQSIVLDSTSITSSVFAYSNLKGMRCSGAIFDDVVMMNCEIELALFQDYMITSCFAICSDNGTASHQLKESVFHCSAPQQNTHSFSISNTEFQSCLFTGYFQPTELISVKFYDCFFGTEDLTCFLQGDMEKEFTSKKWDLQHCEVGNTELINLRDRIDLNECILKDTIKITGCSLESLSITHGEFNKNAAIELSASVLDNLHLAGNDQDDILRVVIINCDGVSSSISTISNPTIDGFSFSGALDCLKLCVEKKSIGHLVNGTFEGISLTESFLHAEGKLELEKVRFIGQSDAPMTLERVSFLNCTFKDVVFENCIFKDCGFPGAERACLNGNDSNRISFMDCIFEGDKLESIDFSHCEFVSSEIFLDKNKNRRVLDYNEIVATTWAGSTLNLPLYDIAFSGCIFSDTAINSFSSSPEIPTITGCSFKKCIHLSIGCSVSACDFQSIKDDEHSIALSEKAAVAYSEFQNCKLLLTHQLRETDEAFFTDCVLSDSLISGNIRKTSRLYRIFDNCMLAGTEFRNLYVSDKAFHHCHLTDIVADNCLIKGKSFIESEISGLEFKESSISDFMRLEECLLLGSYPLSFSDCKSLDQNGDQTRITVKLSGCFYDSIDKEATPAFPIRASIEPIKLRVEGYKNYSSTKVAAPDSKEFDLADDELFKVERTRTDWESDVHLYRFDRREKMFKLWEENGIFEPIGHAILEANESTLAKKKDIFVANLEKVVNSPGLDTILPISSREALKKYATEAIDILKAHSSSDSSLSIADGMKVRKLMLSMVHGTRFRLGSGLPKQDIRYWLAELLDIAQGNIQLINMPDEPDMKFFGNYILLREWIDSRYKRNIKQFHSEKEYKVGLEVCSNCVVLILGGNGQSTNLKSSRFSDFSTLEVLSMLKYWNVLSELRDFSRNWINQNDEKHLELETCSSEGRFRFRFFDGKWDIVGKMDEASSFCNGICFYIPLYGYIPSSERRVN